jgi:hypothetical protein
MAETSKKAAAKATAPKTTGKDDADSAAPTDQTHSHDAVQRGGDVQQDAGPGTGREAGPDEGGYQQARMSGAHAADPSSAPIEAPDLHSATQPVEGHHGSSTVDVRAAVALSSYAGEDHEAIVDEDGSEVDLDDLFEEPENKAATYVTVKRAVYETYYAVGQNTDDQPMTRLLFPAGARVPKAQAYQMSAAQDRSKAQLEQRKAANKPLL